jgi:hypothetical protein
MHLQYPTLGLLCSWKSISWPVQKFGRRSGEATDGERLYFEYYDKRRGVFMLDFHITTTPVHRTFLSHLNSRKSIDDRFV